jgi:capsular exopolysaccharide synthesis family protein
MDSKGDFPIFSPKPNGKPLQLLPEGGIDQPGDRDEETAQLTWLFAVLRRRILVMLGIGVTLAGVSGGLVVWKAKRTIPVYVGSFQLLVEPVTAESRLTQLASQAKRQGEGSIGTIANSYRTDSNLDYESQIKVLQSPQLMNPIIKQLKSQYPDINYNELTKDLSIARISLKTKGEPLEAGTKILEITYKNKDSKKIQNVLNTIAQNYLNYSLQQRQASLRQAIKFIEDRLPDLEKQVDVLQEKVEAVRQQSGWLEPESNSDQLYVQISETETARLQTEAKLAEAKANYATLQQLLAEGNAMAILSQDPGSYQKLLLEAQQIETQIAKDDSRFNQYSPQMQALREKQQNMNLLLLKEAQKNLQKAAQPVQQLEASQQIFIQKEKLLKQRQVQLPLVARKYKNLQRDLTVATDILNDFLSKRETFRIDAAQQQIPWELITPPHIHVDDHDKPVIDERFKTKRLLVLAVILSMLLGFGAGFLIEILHTVFHRPEEIKGATRLPILGVIPFAKKLQKLPKKLNQVAIVAQVANFAPGKDQLLLAGNDNQPNGYSASPFTEAFRSLYTNIRLLSSQKPIYSLAISSATPADGKTTIAVYLAQTAAAMGQRVLLVDADLRFPQLHSRLSLPNVQGLSETIATDLDLNDAIQQSPLYDNLFVLTAGRILSDPIKLLSSDRMQYLMEQFQARFDLVIYDTPPLLDLGDSNLLAANADGTLLVVGLEKTDRSQLMKALVGLKISGASVLGIVANGMRGNTANSYASYRRQSN